MQPGASRLLLTGQVSSCARHSALLRSPRCDEHFFHVNQMLIDDSDGLLAAWCRTNNTHTHTQKRHELDRPRLVVHQSSLSILGRPRCICFVIPPRGNLLFASRTPAAPSTQSMGQRIEAYIAVANKRQRLDEKALVPCAVLASSVRFVVFGLNFAPLMMLSKRRFCRCRMPARGS